MTQYPWHGGAEAVYTWRCVECGKEAKVRTGRGSEPPTFVLPSGAWVLVKVYGGRVWPFCSAHCLLVYWSDMADDWDMASLDIGSGA